MAALKGTAFDALESGNPWVSRALLPNRELLRALTILDAKFSSAKVRLRGGEDEISSGEMFGSSSWLSG